MTFSLVELEENLPDGISLDREITDGGQRRVFAGSQDRVALVVKVTEAGERERTEREVSIGATFDHPNLPRILDAEVVEIELGGESFVWFREELVDGPSLAARRTRLDPCGALALAADLIAAVTYLWEVHDVVHRDIKPANIICRPDGVYVLIDVGIGRHQGRETITTQPLGPGTEGHLAPEQILPNKGRDLDGRTDLFLIGIVLYQTLTGALPFRPNDPDYWTKLAAVEWIRPEGLPKSVAELLERLLGRYPHQRPSLTASAALEGGNRMFLIQDGHQTSAQIEAALPNDADGVIWSPADETPELLAQRSAAALASGDDIVSALDPQLYVAALADANPKRLPRHDIFSMRLRGGAFSANRLARLVERVIDYQVQLPLTHLVTPTVAVAGMNDRSAQIALNLAETSLEVAEGRNDGRSVLLSAAIESYVLSDSDSVNALLDELTAHEVDGFYLLFELDPQQPVERAAALLAEALYITYTLAVVQGRQVWVGYAGLSGYLHRAVGGAGFAAGGFQKQQWFSPRHWRASKGGGRGGPRPRIYLDSLYASLLTDTELHSIGSQRGDPALLADLVSGAGTLAENYRGGTVPPPDRKTCAAQLFAVCMELDRRIAGDVGADLRRILAEIEEADQLYGRIAAAGIELEGRSDSGHLDLWRAAIAGFARRAGVEVA